LVRLLFEISIFISIVYIRNINLLSFGGVKMAQKRYDHFKVNGVAMFTTNSKTACPSWAISRKTCVGAKGCNICKSCYANKGTFRYSATENAVQKRYEWFNENSESLIVDSIVNGILRYNEPYFRVHVSGDFENARSIRIWNRIASKLPEVKFWIPTKAYRIKNLLPALKKLNALPNATVRPSSSDFDIEVPEIEGLSAGLGAYRKTIQKGYTNCPGNCTNCRLCWDSPKEKIAFHKH
jgi:hypothetical protein